MRKITIAIIMLLSVTAVFGQTEKHYSAFQTGFSHTGHQTDVLYPYLFKRGQSVTKVKGATITTNRFWVTNDSVAIKDTVFIHDTIRVRDTVQVPVYLFDVTDTVAATVMYKKSEKSDRIYTVKGFALVRGFKVFVNGKAQWADKPQIVGAIDDKKRPIKNVIQVL